MQWKDVTLDISAEQRTKLKELGSQFNEAMENHGIVNDKILDPLKDELSNVIAANPDVKTILKDAVETGNHYVLRLLDDDNEILNLPWPLAVESDTKTRLGDIETLHLLKTPAKISDKNCADFTPHVAAPLKILIMISSPLDLELKERLSYEKEEGDILKAFEPLLKTGHVQIDYTDDGSLDALKAKIETNQYHILHFSGHGVFKEGKKDKDGKKFENDKGYLQLENHYTLKGELTDEDKFAKAINFNPDYKIPLVVLSSCQTVQGGSEKILSGINQQTLKR
ncbi:MAG: CHAT domain-containing protein [Nitrospirae bacterium]|nr:CHAT domain-containing protein [Nitrospirota bacterium]MBF0618482.1 CHAT domain-containing protein [Nitrospirota bacterium]